MNLVGVLVEQVLWLDDARLQKARDERASSRKGIDDMDALIRNRRLEMLVEDAFHRLHDEVHHRNRRIDNAQLLDRVLERDMEEVVIVTDVKKEES